MPDSPLYPVKLAAEQVRVQLTPTDIGKVKLYVELADKRVSEIVNMAEEEKAEEITVVTQHLDKLLVSMSVLAGGQEERAVMTAPAPTPVPTPALTPPTTEIPPEEADKNGEVLPAAPPPVLSPPSGAERSEATTPQPDDEINRLQTLLSGYAIEHKATLSNLLGEVPESVKEALQQAISVSETGYSRALTALE